MGRMEPRPSRWSCEPYQVAAALRLQVELGVSPVVGSILARRGLTDPVAARRFLDAAERHDPVSLPGVPQAVELIRRHVRALAGPHGAAGSQSLARAGALGRRDSSGRRESGARAPPARDGRLRQR